MLFTEIQLITTTQHYNGSGVACWFYKLTDKIGVKTYRSETVAKRNWQRQKFFHDQFNISAPVGDYLGPISVKNMYGRQVVRYGFITQLAKCNSRDYRFGYKESQRFGCTLRYAKKKVQKADLSPYAKHEALDALESDNHDGNYGEYKGRMVKIDFSEINDFYLREYYPEVPE